MALTKITTNVIEDNAITADKIDTSSLTAAGFATESYVTTAVANLVDSAPVTLDTLNELAAALGDDPNFATTVTNSIGTKAPLASPTFTGTITIPTADINAGTIDGTVIGGSSAAAGTFTTVTASSSATIASNLFFNSTSGAMRFGTDAGTEKATIRLSGNDLKFENSSGIQRLLVKDAGGLDVTGTVTADGLTVDAGASTEALRVEGSGAYISYLNTSNTQSLGFIQGSDTSLNIAAQGSGNASSVNFIAGGSERARIDSSGRIKAASGSAFVSNTITTSSSKTLVNGEQCFVDTATQTITLPASPSIGDNVTIFVGNFTDTTIARNGANIMGLAENLTIDVANMTISLVYINASTGWRIS